jgi:hypothetical protein
VAASAGSCWAAGFAGGVDRAGGCFAQTGRVIATASTAIKYFLMVCSPFFYKSLNDGVGLIYAKLSQLTSK